VTVAWQRFDNLHSRDEFVRHIAVGYCDLGSEFGKAPGARGSDAAGPADHEDNLAVHGWAHCRSSLDRWIGENRVASLHDKAVTQCVPRRANAGRGRLAFVMPAIVSDQRARYPEHDIGFEVFVIINEDLGDERLVPFLESQEVDMRRPKGMSVLGAQHLTDRAVRRDWVACRLDGPKGETTGIVGGEFSAQVHVGLRVVLILIKADRRGLPDVDLDACKGFSGDVYNLALRE
jgi:hypothetical protein